MTAPTEVDVAVVLGATRAHAEVVVQMLLDEGMLSHGVATVAGAAAARWGIEIRDALREMAAGRGVGGSFSDYELRVGREEAEADLEDAWARRRADDDSAWSRLLDTTGGHTESDAGGGADAVRATVPASVHHLAVRDVVATG